MHFSLSKGGCLSTPLSPLEAPTVWKGVQGTQWALVKAFQESGSSEGGGEAEGGGGGLALWNTACSWNSHGTGRAKHEMPTNKEKHYTKQRAFGPSTEMNKGKKNKWGAYEGSKQWQETCDAIVRGQRGRRWRDYRLIKVLQIDYNVCAHTLLTWLKEKQPVLMIKLALAISSNKTQKLNPAKAEREGICITAKRNKLLTPANITKQTQNPSLKLQRVINCKLAYIYLLCSNSGLTDCCLRSRVCLFCIGNWPSKEMRFFTGGWLKVWARRRNWKPASGSSSGKAGGEPGGEWPGDSSSCWRGQNV